MPSSPDHPACGACAPAGHATCHESGFEFAVPEGVPVLDAALDQGCLLDHGCRIGACGACAVEIVEGLEHADPPDEIEANSLERFGLPPQVRLACRMTTRGPMKLRPA